MKNPFIFALLASLSAAAYGEHYSFPAGRMGDAEIAIKEGTF